MDGMPLGVAGSGPHAHVTHKQIAQRSKGRCELKPCNRKHDVNPDLSPLRPAKMRPTGLHAASVTAVQHTFGWRASNVESPPPH